MRGLGGGKIDDAKALEMNRPTVLGIQGLLLVQS